MPFRLEHIRPKGCYLQIWGLCQAQHVGNCDPTSCTTENACTVDSTIQISLLIEQRNITFEQAEKFVATYSSKLSEAGTGTFPIGILEVEKLLTWAPNDARWVPTACSSESIEAGREDRFEACQFIFNLVAQYWSETVAQFICEING